MRKIEKIETEEARAMTDGEIADDLERGIKTYHIALSSGYRRLVEEAAKRLRRVK